jgi:hypothetical protein
MKRTASNHWVIICVGPGVVADISEKRNASSPDKNRTHIPRQAPVLLIFLPRHNGPSGPRSPYYRGFLIALIIRHTTLCKNPLDEWSAHRIDLYLITHITHKRETSMSSDGIRTHIPSKRATTDHALDRAPTGIGCSVYYTKIFHPKCV